MRHHHSTAQMVAGVAGVAAILALGVLVAEPAGAGVFTVTTTSDTLDGNCDAHCSLREAIVTANGTPGPDEVRLGPGLYRLTRDAGVEEAGATGDLDVTDDLTLTGAGAASTTIDGGGIDRILDIHFLNSGDVAVADLTLRNGHAREPSGDGGAIFEPEPAHHHALPHRGQRRGRRGRRHLPPLRRSHHPRQHDLRQHGRHGRRRHRQRPGPHGARQRDHLRQPRAAIRGRHRRRVFQPGVRHHHQLDDHRQPRPARRRHHRLPGGPGDHRPRPGARAHDRRRQQLAAERRSARWRSTPTTTSWRSSERTAPAPPRPPST